MMGAISNFIPDSKFTVLAYRANYDQYPIKVVETIGNDSSAQVAIKTLSLIIKSYFWMLFYRIFGLNIKFLNKKILQEYIDADIVINTGGDNLTEDYGLLSLVFNFSYLLVGLILSKPVVIYAESIGPFKGKISKTMARFIFNRVNLITIREELSKKHLQKIKIDKTPIYFTADSAFLLEASENKRIREILSAEGVNKNSRPLVGLSVSKIISRYGFADIKDPNKKYEEYITVMAHVVDYITDNLDATVIFVPHVIDPKGNDDMSVADDICGQILNNQKIVSIKEEYTPEELKGIIGCCDLFIGARMHATIASTSMLVPTVGIAYSHKMHGIIGEMLEQEKYILDIKDLDYKTLISKINDAWGNREKIKKELEVKIPMIKEKAMSNGKLVKELLDSLEIL
jgi:polysaccharide pyruvyl transferase WcaK-like protein